MSDKPLVPPEETDAPEAGVPSIFDKPDHSHDKDRRRGKLSRGARSLLVTLLACAVLAGGIFAVVRFLPKPEQTDVNSGLELTLFDYSDAIYFHEDTYATQGLQDVTVQNRTGRYTVTYTVGETTKANEVTGEQEVGPGYIWTVADHDGVEFDSESLQFLITDLLKVRYVTTYVPDASAANADGVPFMQECGFDDPEATLAVRFHDGRGYTITLGNKLPTGENRYMMQSDDPAVYVVKENQLSYYLRDLSYYVSKQVQAALPTEALGEAYVSGETLDGFDRVTLQGAGMTAPLVLEMADNTQPGVPTRYRLTAPESRPADSDRVAELLAPLVGGLTAIECEVMSATAEQMSEYGFDAPTAFVTYELNGWTVTLQLGRQLGEGYYAIRRVGCDSIWRVADSGVGFFFRSERDYRSTLLYLTAISDVASLRVDALNDSGTLISETFRLQSETSVSSNGPTVDLTVTDSRGNTVDPAAFRTFYQALLGLAAAGWTDAPETPADPRVTVTLTYTSGGSDVIRLSPYSGRRYLYTLNGGKGDALVLSSAVDALLGQYADLLS